MKNKIASPKKELDKLGAKQWAYWHFPDKFADAVALGFGVALAVALAVATATFAPCFHTNLPFDLTTVYT